MHVELDGWRILLVEDERVLALGVADLLGDLGAIVLGPVATVADALALIDQVPELDAALLDINLGDDVAYPVADALAARGTPFVFASANARNVLPARFANASLCQKPFSINELSRTLQDLHDASLSPPLSLAS